MVDFAKLTAPFPPEKVSWRVGSTTKDKTKGMALAYIDARDVMERLDAVCGSAGWQCSYPHANGKTCCAIGIKIEDEWVWKADGAGDTDFEANKGAFSDAFKRAAVKWGIGRYLYDVASPWVEIEPAGKSYRIIDKELPKLRVLLMGEGQPSPRQEAAKPPADPEVEKAREAFKRIQSGLRNAKNVKGIDALMAANKDDLDLIGEVHSKSLDDLIELADMRRMDFQTGAAA